MWDRICSNTGLAFLGGVSLGALLMATIAAFDEQPEHYVHLNSEKILVNNQNLARLALLYAGPRPTPDSYPARCDVLDIHGQFVGTEIHWKRTIDDGQTFGEITETSGRVVRVRAELGYPRRRFRE